MSVSRSFAEWTTDNFEEVLDLARPLPVAQLGCGVSCEPSNGTVRATRIQRARLTRSTGLSWRAMTNSDSTDLTILSQVSAAFERLCGSIEVGQWKLPTPCTDWDLSQLVDHVTGGNRFTISILSGQSAEAAMDGAMESFDKSHQPGEAAISSIRTQRESFSKPGVLDQICHHVGGEMLGREVLRLRLHDLIVHTWDMSQTLNPPASIPAAFVDWALTEIADPASLTKRHFGLDTNMLVAGDGVPSQVVLLAAFGRSARLVQPDPSDHIS